jgi:predicted RNA-binding Zn ribbon-like protein
MGAELLDANAAVTAADHARALAVREALRELTAANAGLQHDPEAPSIVNAAARRARLAPILTAPGQARLTPAASGIDAALGQIIAAMHAAIADHTWPRLKACERDSCRWAFYDRSKNQTSRWCATTVCGAREKNKRAYRRRRS